MKEIKDGSFIFYEDGVLSPGLCSEIIERFEKDTRVTRGQSGSKKLVQTHIKDTYDLHISSCTGWTDIDAHLHATLLPRIEIMVRDYEGLRYRNTEDTGYQIQKYDVGSKGYIYHADAMNSDQLATKYLRQIAFIFYLNDVDLPDYGGCTHFKYQDIGIQPKTGRLALFPPFWTHLHASLPAPGHLKYIITGWICFVIG